MNTIINLIEKTYYFLWGDWIHLPLPGGTTINLPLLVLLLVPTGIFCTIQTRFLQIRMLPDMLRALLEKAYPGQTAEAEFLFLPRHPQGPPLDVNAVLDAWRERSGEKLLLVTTARADATAHACAAKLARPAVRLIDGERLCALLTAFPPPKRVV